jgi:flavin reductase
VVLRCELIASHDAFTHSIFIGKIGHASVNAPGAEQCLLWHRHRFAGSTAGVADSLAASRA